LIYSLFTTEVGLADSCFGSPSAKNCIYAMFHHSTPEKNKKITIENFSKSDSKLQVVIDTTAFGMGVNVPDIHRVFHWGASKTFQGFMQESRRAGRDNHQSESIIYYHPIDISTTATDNNMREFCKLKICRRNYLLQHISPENLVVANKQVAHRCCDNCVKLCKCKQCPSDFNHLFLKDNDDDNF